MKKNYFHDQSDHCGIDVIVTNNTNTSTTANSPNEPYSPINAQIPCDCGSYGHAGNAIAQSITTPYRSHKGNDTETPTTSSVTTTQTATYIGPQNDDVLSKKEEGDLKRDWAFIRKEVWGFPVTKAALFIIAVFVTLRLLHVI